MKLNGREDRIVIDNVALETVAIRPKHLHSPLDYQMTGFLLLSKLILFPLKTGNQHIDVNSSKWMKFAWTSSQTKMIS